MRRIKQLLLSERRNIYLFYLLSAVMSFWFIASNWIYFWTKYMTFGQLGWVDALGFGFAMLLEVPSGAIADLIGKRKTIFFGAVAGTIGVFIVTFSGSLTGIFIGWMITQICYAFYSGAAEALAYDTLVDLKQENQFDHVITKSSQIENFSGAIATFIGGLLYAVNFRLPHILWGTGFLFAAIFAYLLVEPKIDTEKFSFKRYRFQLFAGLKELAQKGLREYIGFFFVLTGVYYIYSWGFIRPAIATSFGFFSREQGIILPVLTIVGALCVRAIPALKKRVSELMGLVILSVFMILGFGIAIFPVGWYGLIAMALIAVAGHMASPWISIIVNKKITSKNRATTLSTIALMTKLPYVLVAVIAGRLVQNGQLAVFNKTAMLTMLFITMLSLGLIGIKRLAKSKSMY